MKNYEKLMKNYEKLRKTMKNLPWRSPGVTLAWPRRSPGVAPA